MFQSIWEAFLFLKYVFTQQSMLQPMNLKKKQTRNQTEFMSFKLRIPETQSFRLQSRYEQD